MAQTQRQKQKVILMIDVSLGSAHRLYVRTYAATSPGIKKYLTERVKGILKNPPACVRFWVFFCLRCIDINKDRDMDSNR